jgi:hypothetical protein
MTIFLAIVLGLLWLITGFIIGLFALDPDDVLSVIMATFLGMCGVVLLVVGGLLVAHASYEAAKMIVGSK